MLKFLTILPILGLLAAPAFAATGTAKGVNPDASAKTGSETRTLVVGADVFIGDLVKTGPAGQVQIKFSDNTELVVGPRSSMVIEDYLLREDGSAGKMVINTFAGTFRFVTGNAPKDRYLITTPTGTIGVRGTAFDFTNEDNIKSTSIMLYHGVVVACNLDGKCVVLDDVCEVGEYGSGDAYLLGHADDIKGEARKVMRGLFEYAEDQTPLMREFRIDNSYRCLHKPTDVGGTESIADPIGGRPPVDSPSTKPPGGGTQPKGGRVGPGN